MRFFQIAFVLFTAAVSVLANPVAKREAPKSAAAILTDLSNTATPLAHKLLYATRENATKENLTPIIHNLNTAVTGSVTSMKLLAGQPTDVIMGSVDGTGIMSTSDLAYLLASIVNLIFMAANAVLQVVESEIVTIINSLLATLGQVVFSLISCVLSLVTGLLGPLLTLIAPVLSIISSLGLTDLLGELLGGLLGGL